MNKSSLTKGTSIFGIVLLIYVAIRFVIQGLVMRQLQLHFWYNEMWITAIALILLFGGAYLSKIWEEE